MGEGEGWRGKGEGEGEGVMTTLCGIKKESISVKLPYST